MSVHRDRYHRAARAAASVASVAALTGCGIGLDRLPLPAHSTEGQTFSLTAVFATALNLPTKAKVKFNGADIGEVTAIQAHDYTAWVTMQVRSDVPLYTGSTAELRSATPLGDIFVALKSGPGQPDTARRLTAGDTIPLTATSAGATIEEVLTSASLLVNGGLARRLVTVVNGTGRAVGGQGAKIATLLHDANEVLSRLTARSAQIRDSLMRTSELATAVSAQQTTLNAAIAATGPAVAVIADNVTQINQLTDTAAGISRDLSRFPSLQGTDTRSVIADLNNISVGFNSIVTDPAISMTALNRVLPIFIKLNHSAGTSLNANFVQLALGNHPDKNYPGDPAMHGPDGTDWHAMVGSVRYSWNLLLDRIYGAQR